MPLYFSISSAHFFLKESVIKASVPASIIVRSRSSIDLVRNSMSLIKPLDEKLIDKCKVLFSDDFQELLNTINWDITSVFIFEYFKKIYTNSFYYDLLKVYKSGHIPCGWKGKFPEGKLLIY